jgi:putative inorganic carbon (hco3(-)) transporter
MAVTSAPTATSAAPSALRLPVRFWQIAIVAAAVPLGVAAAFRPTLAVAALLALAFLPLLLTRPIVGLSVVLLMSFLERFSAITGVVSLTKMIGALLVLSWFAVVATTPAGERARAGLVARQPLLAAALVLLAAWGSISLAWAEQPAEAQNSVLRFALNFLLFPIALVAIRRQRDVAWLFGVFIAGALLTVALGFLVAPTGNPADAARLEGAVGNPNQLGSYLVVAMVLSAAFINQRWPPTARAAALAAATIAAVGLFLTLSRGALLGLAAALLVAPFVVGRGRRAAALVLVVLTVAGTATWYAAIAPADSVDRITHPERGGGSGREDLWRVGWRMISDRPLVGVGAGNFGVSSIHYLLRPGSTQRDKYIVVRHTVAHNIYLTVLAELGIVGLTLFVLILLICLRCALLAAREFAARRDPTMELLARALLIALVGLLVADFFSSALYSKQLWFLLAATPALLALARRPGTDERRETPPQRLPRVSA